MENAGDSKNKVASFYDIIKLQKDESVESFDCGDIRLNDFILNESMAYRKSLLAVSYVLVDKEHSDNVVAYFSLANDNVSVNNFENNTEFNRFRKRKFTNGKRLANYPAAKICRLAVDLSMKGKSIGTFLLDFIKSYFIRDNKTGCRFLTVDAYAAAVPFYLKNGFLPLTPDDEYSRTRSLYFDLNDIAE